MKTIKFSDKELGFIRQQYQVELEEAQEYVENLKNILKKIGAPEDLIPAVEATTEPKRRGRKPKVKTEVQSSPGETVEKKRKTRKDKGKKRGKRVRPTVKEKPMSDSNPAPASNEESEKADDSDTKVSPKKKVRKQPRRRRGVFLTPLRKPI